MALPTRRAALTLGTSAIASVGLTAGAALPVSPAAAVPSAASDANPDSELIALCQQFEVADRQHWADYSARMQEITALDLPKADDTAARNLVLRRSRTYEPKREAMLEQIAALPATTPEGLAAKAGVMRGMLGSWDTELPPFTASDALLSSLVRDCMRGQA